MLENQSNKENINFTEFIISLWNGKWILFFTILFFILISYIFLYFNDSYSGNIEIETIDSHEHQKYAVYEISQLIFFARLEKRLLRYDAFIDDATVAEGEPYSDILFIKLGKKDLLERFVEQIRNTSKIKDMIFKSNYFNEEEIQNKNKYENEIENILDSMNLQFFYKKQQNKVYYKLNFQFNEIKVVKNLLNEIFSNANLEVQKQLIEEFENLIIVNQQIINAALEMLYDREEQSIADYNHEINSKIDYLMEQSKIAKKINLEKDSIFALSERGVEITNLLTDSPDYLRGYLSIDEEIKIIKNRKNVKSFIPDAFLIYQGIDYFKSKTITADLQNMFKKTPIYSNENFKSVSFNINKLQISSTYNSYLFYALSIMFGFLFALFIIFLKDIIINIKK